MDEKKEDFFEYIKNINIDNNEETITTQMFLNELKKQVQFIYRKRLSNEKLSLILGQSKRHIENYFHKAKYNPEFKIALDFLEEYIINLKFRFGKKKYKCNQNY